MTITVSGDKALMATFSRSTQKLQQKHMRPAVRKVAGEVRKEGRKLAPRGSAEDRALWSATYAAKQEGLPKLYQTIKNMPVRFLKGTKILHSAIGPAGRKGNPLGHVVGSPRKMRFWGRKSGRMSTPNDFMERAHARVKPRSKSVFWAAVAKHIRTTSAKAFGKFGGVS